MDVDKLESTWEKLQKTTQMLETKQTGPCQEGSSADELAISGLNSRDLETFFRKFSRQKLLPYNRRWCRNKDLTKQASDELIQCRRTGLVCQLCFHFCRKVFQEGKFGLRFEEFMITSDGYQRKFST